MKIKPEIFTPVFKSLKKIDNKGANYEKNSNRFEHSIDEPKPNLCRRNDKSNCNKPKFLSWA